MRINTEQASKEFSLTNLRSAGQLLPHILDKVWVLYESKAQFLISDNPVGLQNTVNKSKHRGTLGLAVRGIEVYLPISPCYTLGLICRDTFNAFLAYFEMHHQALDRAGSFELRNFVNSVRRRLPISCTIDNVENLNSIQVVAAERFIFSRDGNFDLAQAMIRNSPGLTVGPRMEIR